MMIKAAFCVGLVWFCAPHIADMGAAISAPCLAECPAPTVQAREVLEQNILARLNEERTEIRDDQRRSGQDEFRVTGEEVREVVRMVADHLATIDHDRRTR